ncbi:hypothetical protein BP6252_03983 [Coleophoma cylindrospora]|uniref:Cupin type-1 domain-containing protein n=1 Tax=Coleophoma cylindrospora TaxID=1849047 RepID=A0A3D8S9R2_9HELO|nr:hypothetical protein BP6252_03983 [Coleophoma cylindrospora]
MALKQPISVPSICAKVTIPFSQTLVANLNDSYDIKHALLDGSVPFHNHIDSDEAFYLLSGELTIEISNYGDQGNNGNTESVEIINIKVGDFFVVPKAVFHRPVGKSAHVLVVEKKGIPGGNGEMVKEIE